MDARHFRERAAKAREMAQFGDDLRLLRMLLDVASDLDAEAAAIEAEMMALQTGSGRTHRVGRPALVRAVCGKSKVA